MRFKEITDYKQPIYYFAYGMLCDPEIMGDTPLVGVGTLHGYQFTLQFYANVEKSPGDTVQGCVWEIDDAMLAELDRIEGYPRVYTRFPVQVEVDGETVTAQVYAMTPQTKASMEDREPSEDYIQRIVRGYKHAGVSTSQLADCLSISHFQQNLTESTDYSIKILNPGQLTDSEFGQVCDLVASGGEVATSAISSGISRAHLLGIALSNKKVIAVTALKQPLQSYQEKVFATAGVPEISNKYKYELGYSFTAPGYRTSGVSIALHSKLFAQTSESAWASVRTDNRAALVGLQRLGFIPLGEPYQSSRGNYTITLLGTK